MAVSRFLNYLLITLTFCGPQWSHSASVNINSPESGTGLFWQITDIHWDTHYSLDGDPTNMCHVSPALAPDTPTKSAINSGLTSSTEDDTVLRGNGLFQEIQDEMEKITHPTKNRPVRHHSGTTLIRNGVLQHPELREKRNLQFMPSGKGGLGEAEPMQVEHPNGMFGNYLCDAPWQLVKTTLDAMVTLNSNPDFILWTGDMAPHVQDPAPHFPVIFSTLNNVTRELLRRFPAPVAVLPVLGNHDTFPKDDYPDCPKEFYDGYLQEGGWALLLDASQQDTFSKGGFYSHVTPSGLTVAVINTNLYYMGNKRGSGDSDPCGQLAWFAQLLQKARAIDTKVLVTAHSPAGFFERMPIIPFFNDTYNERYLDLITEYSDVIHSHVYGHLHTDTFRLYDGGSGAAGSVGFLAPSVTPWQASRLFGGTAINPSLRLYSYDTLSVVDYTQYHLNLTQANKPGHSDLSSLPAEYEASMKETEDTTTASLTDVAAGVVSPIATIETGGATETGLDGPGTDDEIMTFTTEVGDIWSMNRDLKGVPDEAETASRDEIDCKPNVDDKCNNPNSNLRSLQAVPLSRTGLEDTAPIGPQKAISDQAHILNNEQSVEWVVFYEARKAYSLERLDAANMEALYNRLESDEGLFNEYYVRNSAGFDSGACNSTCRHAQLCSIRYSRVGDLLRCTRYSKTSFAELLGKTFSRYNASEYDKYFQEDGVAISQEIPGAVPQSIDVGKDDAFAGPTTLPTPESSSTNSLPKDEADLSAVAGEEGTVASSGIGISAMVFMGCVASVWLVMGVLYAAVRLRRYKNRARTGLLGGRPETTHVGYTPLYGNDD